MLYKSLPDEYRARQDTTDFLSLTKVTTTNETVSRISLMEINKRNGAKNLSKIILEIPKNSEVVKLGVVCKSRSVAL